MHAAPRKTEIGIVPCTTMFISGSRPDIPLGSGGDRWNNGLTSSGVVRQRAADQ
jgi:hypothetical protein